MSFTILDAVFTAQVADYENQCLVFVDFRMINLRSLWAWRIENAEQLSAKMTPSFNFNVSIDASLAPSCVRNRDT